MQPALAPGLRRDGDGAGFEILGEHRDDGKVRDGGLRQGIEEDAAKDAGEADEVLVLKPGAGGEAEDPHGQDVLAVFECVGERKIRGGEAVLTVADVAAVEPEGKAALHALEGDAHRVVPEALGQGEGGHIVHDGVKVRRHLAGL